VASPDSQAGPGHREHGAARDGDLEIGREERVLRLLGVVLKRADDLQDAPNVADFPIGLGVLVQHVELGIVVGFEAPLLHQQRRGVAEDPGAVEGLLDPVERPVARGPPRSVAERMPVTSFIAASLAGRPAPSIKKG
jgi:hypothetical protein